MSFLRGCHWKWPIRIAARCPCGAEEPRRDEDIVT
ncbi:MAG: NADPH-dependent ferric siderophore reductase, partial [Dermacoccus nishinomiyaensis]